ncbi:Cullin family Cullin protein neddylation domain [Trypanosoma vivax]|nr:putative cullin 4B [Trypanosoma vivax]KAH8605621.1 Cullin family Cullin protein neddylation domain [Trypanosoma vivax]
MTSRTLYDPITPQPFSNEEVQHPKPCVVVHLQEQDHERHAHLCEMERKRAWDTANIMLDAVLSRSTAKIEAVAAAVPPFTESIVQLQPLLLFFEKTSPRNHTATYGGSCALSSSPKPNVNFINCGYLIDKTCTSVHTLVQLGCAEELLVKLEQRLKEHAVHIVQVLAGACEAGASTTTTSMRLAHAWGHYRLVIAELQDVWVYLDRLYVFNNSTVKSIEGLGVNILRNELLSHAWLLPDAQTGYISSLRSDLETSTTQQMSNGVIEPNTYLRTELRLLTDLFTAMQVYFLRLEPEILKEFSNFYKELGERLWQNGTTAEVFFPLVEGFLQEDRRRVDICLDSNSLLKIEETAQTSLLDAHGVAILERDFPRLAENESYGCFSLAWKLLACGTHVQLGRQCSLVFRDYVLRESSNIIAALPAKGTDGDPFAVVKGIIALMNRGKSIVSNGFARDKILFSSQLLAALEEGLREKQMEFAEQLARYLDWVVRECEDSDAFLSSDVANKESTANSSASTGSAGTAKLLRDIGSIYGLFPSKDVFEAFYWRDLARRLLFPPRGTPHVEVEEYFDRIIREAGGCESSKFEGMINDLRSSSELNQQFQSWVADAGSTKLVSGVSHVWTGNEESGNGEGSLQTLSEPGNDCGREGGEASKVRVRDEEGDEEISLVAANLLKTVDVKVNILTDGFWPKQTPLDVNLPLPLRALCSCVHGFYRSCFADRHLLWQHQLSTAVVKSFVGGVKRQLTGTVLQVAMLLTLQDVGDPQKACETTLGVLCTLLGVDISLPDVSSAVLGLCHPKFHLLLRNPAERAGGGGGDGLAPHAKAPVPCHMDDVLRLNEKFFVSTPTCRIPFPGARRRPGGTSNLTNAPVVSAVPLASTENQASVDDDIALTAEVLAKERAHVIEAVIVRFMKEHRRVSHDELVEGVPPHLRFPVTVSAVKEAVERLIERGFLERSKPSEYTYIS